MNEFLGPIVSYVFLALEFATGVAIVVKFRGTATALLGGSAFGLWALSGIVREVLSKLEYPWWEFDYVFTLVGLAGAVCLLLAILVAPRVQAPVHPAARGPVSKGLYLGSILGGLGASILLSLLSLASSASGEPETGLVLAGLAFLPLVYGVVMLAVLVYKMWAAIQDGPARTTPGRAVGFLFIPVFNVYWIFQAYWGWATDFNRYAADRNLNLPRMPEGLALALCILALCGVIPVVGWFLAPVNIVLLGVFFARACDGVNSLEAARTAGPEPTGEVPSTAG